MNGIIHNCTHKDSDDATFRMTEEQMFIAIFNYIEHLFGKIKPKQLFFMAIDGVAPRAKMNQQRARRFRTALDVENAREKAIREGKEMPKEEAFDSNAITPGRSLECNSHNGAYNYRYGVHGETDNAVEIFHQQKSFRRCRVARR
jgi:5'-3' exoribonuclease 1